MSDEKKKTVSTLSTHGGASADGESLCKSCVYSVWIHGFREDQEVTYCRLAEYAPVIPFPVRECNAYMASKRMPLSQMDEIALIIEPTIRIKSLAEQAAEGTIATCGSKSQKS